MSSKTTTIVVVTAAAAALAAILWARGQRDELAAAAGPDGGAGHAGGGNAPIIIVPGPGGSGGYYGTDPYAQFVLEDDGAVTTAATDPSRGGGGGPGGGGGDTSGAGPGAGDAGGAGGGGALDEFRAGLLDGVSPYALGSTVAFAGLSASAGYLGSQWARRWNARQPLGRAADLDDVLPAQRAAKAAGVTDDVARSGAKAAGVVDDVARGASWTSRGVGRAARAAGRVAGPVGAALSYGDIGVDLVKGDIDAGTAGARAVFRTPGVLTLGALNVGDDGNTLSVGLPIVTPIVEALGGKLSFTSRDNSAPRTQETRLQQATTTTPREQRPLPGGGTPPPVPANIPRDSSAGVRIVSPSARAPPAAPAPPAPSHRVHVDSHIANMTAAAPKLQPPPSVTPQEFRRVHGGYVV